MRSIIGHLPKLPRTSIISRSLGYYPIEKSDSSDLKLIRTTTLLPDNQDHFDLFKKILTSEKIVFTSSWIDKWYDLSRVKQHCVNFKKRLDLTIEDGLENAVPNNLVERFKNGESSEQLALDQFFSTTRNQEKLSKIYREITLEGHKGLGYYAFHTENNTLLGGGALAPLSKQEPIDKVDVALHILDQRKGIGKIAMNILLKKAFEECKVSEVWGTSIKGHPATPKICSHYSMMIQYNEENGMQYYLLTKGMWDEVKQNLDKIRRNPIAASTFYSDREETKQK